MLHSLGVKLLDLTSHDDGHDNPVNGDGFAENDADQVLGSDSRGFDAAADDAGTRRIDASGGADDRERDSQTDSHTSPEIRWDGSKEASDIELSSSSTEGVVETDGREGRYGYDRAIDRIIGSSPIHFESLNV